MVRQTTKLRELLATNDYLVAPCAYDALSARAIQAAGFKIAGTTGYGMHGAVLGQPDTGLLALNETVSILSKMADAVDIPILADAEGGYGSAMNVIRTIKEYEKTGVGGLFIEDQKQPPNCPFIKAPELVSTDEMVGKIRAAVDTRKDKDLVIIARTDAPFEEAIERANAYMEAGADMVKILPKTREELEALPSRVNGPIHLGLYANKGINDGMTAADCGKLGYKIITFPMSCLFANVAATMSILQYIQENGTDEGYTGKVMQFNEYLKFIGVDEYKTLISKYL
ncbi:2%2C3-dimethylmalate lyase [uncultured Clostridium sp.]|nr:2%2C3-dimethylmalate lyase [uncultured Clostridium sp.]